MLKPYLELQKILGLTLALTVTSCQTLPTIKLTPNLLGQNQPDKCSDLFQVAINLAEQTAILTQKAKTAKEWNRISHQWVKIIKTLQAIPPSNPRWAFSQKKITEYLNNLEIARIKTIRATKAAIPTFNSGILDDQKLLYKSYIAIFGPPDILIVGSSRSLQGIDPKVLQQALNKQGRSSLKVFNLSFNGATAQGVELLLQELLTPNQLPRLIIWGDGVRAINSGRSDRTYNSIKASPGYKQIKSPSLKNLTEPEPELEPESELETCISNQPSPPQIAFNPSLCVLPDKSNTYCLAKLDLLSQINPPQSLNFNLTNTPTPNTTIDDQPLSLIASTPATLNSTPTTDSLGFLPISIKFDPATYYKRFPRVSGLYDGDYAAFNLEGVQTKALVKVAQFAKSNKITLIFVNLPLHQEYFDQHRTKYEDQYLELMNKTASKENFIFIDLGKLWPTQNSYFFDPSHLNRFGAAAVSQELAKNNRIPWPTTINK